jgi:hypothetical protein
MAFWACRQDAASLEHVHDYDEYMLVVQGCYALIINGERIPGRSSFLGISDLRSQPTGRPISSLPLRHMLRRKTFFASIVMVRFLWPKADSRDFLICIDSECFYITHKSWLSGYWKGSYTTHSLR